MVRSTLQGTFDKGRLRWLLALFFLALLVPTFVLVHQARSRLKWEAFHQHRILAEELSDRLDSRFAEIVDVEERRSFADYAFLTVVGDPSANFLQRSTLSNYPVMSELPGLLGYFQVDSEGRLSTPLIPPANASSYGISNEELGQREEVERQIHDVLSKNSLVRSRLAEAEEEPALAESLVMEDSDAYRAQERDAIGEKTALKSSVESPESRSYSADGAFDRLQNTSAGTERARQNQRPNTVGRVDQLKLDSSLEAKSRSLGKASQAPSESAAAPARRTKRKEQTALPELQQDLKRELNAAPEDLRVATFESEIDPFEFSLLDSGHFVLFRKVWRDGQRYIQGAVLNQRGFLDGVIAPAFERTALSEMSDLIVAYEGEVLRGLGKRSAASYFTSSEEFSGDLLYRTRLAAPLGGLELIYTITSLPTGPGGTFVNWTALILIIVLCGGFYAMYRLGVGQIRLARQQQDFVSAVSHELKTPLTSIRMYGEMLRAGWASEEKKRSYYDFIHEESERLSRLISNVLQLASLTRNDPQFDLKPVTAGELMDMVQSKTSTQVDRAGFELRIDIEDAARNVMVAADSDCFAQIMINLIDNALKFSAKAEQKAIELSARRSREGAVVFAVRDFGPGVGKDQMKKIFKLFYRSENELTRETVGTGIGLALVNQLAAAMGAKVDVRNVEPGAEFRLLFPPASV